MMTLLENFPQLNSWKIQLFATDISDTVLNKAKLGAYNQIEVNRGLPAKMLVKYFENKKDVWYVKDVLKKSITFKNLNFVEKWSALPFMDIIFIRNVLIYFNRERKQDILSRMSKQLNKGGKLILGSSETTIGFDVPLKCETFKNGCCYKVN